MMSCYYSPSMSIKRNILPALAIAALSLAGIHVPVYAADEEPEPGILTPPAIEDSVLYFVNWPDMLYAFDEAENRVRWSASLDPPLQDFEISALPAPSPTPILSYLIVHLGNQLWGVSKVDGRSVWSVENLPVASHRNASRSVNPLPGYYTIEEESGGSLITLELEDGLWQIRSRRLGDGEIEWDTRLPGVPRGWWVDRDRILITCELYGESGPESTDNRPAAIIRLDPDTGETVWSVEPANGTSLRATFRSTYQAIPMIFLQLELPSGEFQVSSYREETGEKYRTITYSAGEHIATLNSGDKIVFLHREGSEEQRQVRFLLYYSSLNPIRFQTIRESRTDMIFPEPMVDGNLLLYAGTVYSLYDGRQVWREDVQRWQVGWASDDYYVYIWDAAGTLIALDRLTGQLTWETPFNVLPPEVAECSHYCGAGLVLADNRLIATTPAGEVLRVDPVTGEPYPGILRVSRTEEGDGLTRDVHGGEHGMTVSVWIWVSIAVLVILGAAFLWFGRKPSI